MAESVVRAQFDPTERRRALTVRLLELRSLIPQLEEEKARIEGQILLLDELMQPREAPPEGSRG